MISVSGGWALDYKMFSNVSINILFEISLRDVNRLLTEILKINVQLTNERISLLEEVTQKQAQLSEDAIFDIPGTLQITFIHNDPDLKIPVPPFNLLRSHSCLPTHCDKIAYSLT
ncbi:hypothetical protein DES34_101725 [Brevibacillus brevis]|nr:hypothetical protein C7J99_24280 [Brevibacillus brevis]RED36055.1 hypothetical protein DES34_101725 [Brevibacillus brevis]GEC88542.1 hypothetical protein BBR01nite_08730 [Brevibacillus brevis]VEF88835.1 Uncharacterised protein [Brevibacillus brevis]